MRKVTDIHTINVFLIHVIGNDLTMRDVYCHSKSELDEKVSELCTDTNVHDFTIWQKIDFDLEEN